MIFGQQLRFQPQRMQRPQRRHKAHRCRLLHISRRLPRMQRRGRFIKRFLMCRQRQHLPVRIEPHQHAMRIRQSIKLRRQRGRQTGGQHFRVHQCPTMLIPRLRAGLGNAFFQKVGQHQHIGHGAMAAFHSKIEALDDAVEIMLVKFRIKPARQLHRTQSRRSKMNAGAPEFMAQKGIVEAAVVRHHQCAAQKRQQHRRQLGKSRRSGHHFIIDAGEAGDKRRNRLLGVHQPLVLRHVSAFKAQQRHFGNTVFIHIAAGGFQIHHRHRHAQTGKTCRQLRPMRGLRHIHSNNSIQTAKPHSTLFCIFLHFL